MPSPTLSFRPSRLILSNERIDAGTCGSRSRRFKGERELGPVEGGPSFRQDGLTCGRRCSRSLTRNRRGFLVDAMGGVAR